MSLDDEFDDSDFWSDPPEETREAGHLPSGHYHYEGGEYCENCVPDANYAEVDQGEQDSPAHCCECHVLLDCTLTSHGVDYVLEYLRDAVASGKTTDVEREWATMLKPYCLDKSQQKKLDKYHAKFQVSA